MLFQVKEVINIYLNTSLSYGRKQSTLHFVEMRSMFVISVKN